MSESDLYRNGGTVRTSNINKRNEQDAAELQAIKSQDRDSQLVNSAREEGFREGFSDFEQRMANSNQWSPVVEGSPQDIQMQESINSGLNYQEPQEPSLLDSISNMFGSGTEAVEEPQVTGNEPQSAFLQGQEQDQMQYDSEQAGLAELEQLLRSQQ